MGRKNCQSCWINIGFVLALLITAGASSALWYFNAGDKAADLLFRTLAACGAIIGAWFVWKRIALADEKLDLERETALLERFRVGIDMLISGDPVKIAVAETELKTILRVSDNFDDAVREASLKAIPENEFPRSVKSLAWLKPDGWGNSLPENHVAVVWKKCRFNKDPIKRIYAATLKKQYAPTISAVQDLLSKVDIDFDTKTEPD